MNITASWEAIRPWLPIALPMLLPKAFQYYKSFRSRPASNIRPLSSKTYYALGLLFITGLIALISILPNFSPENIFVVTKSWPHMTTGSVLLTRVKKLRDPTPIDEALCELFNEPGKVGETARKLYARFGPDVLLNNPISRVDELEADRSFLTYAMPSILAPHLLHILALGIATSTLFSGKESARWRTVAILAGIALAGLEIYLVVTWDASTGMRGTQLSEIEYIHWSIRAWRGLAIAVADAVLGWMIWLQGTGRAFMSPAPPVERVADHSRRLEQMVHNIKAFSVVKNGTMRDAVLRRKVDDYWVREQEAMGDMLEQPEVVRAQRNVLAKKDMGVVRRDVGQFVDGLFTMAGIGNAGA